MSLKIEQIAPRQTLEPPTLESTSSIFTVSREDVYDYKRCPKIVAIKAYRATRTKRPRRELDQAKPPIPNIVGQIGEAAVELAFARGTQGSEGSFEVDNLSPSKTPERGIAQLVASRLKATEKGIQLDLELLAKKTIEGLREIRGQIDQALGPLAIVGRGESRYGVLPTCGYPDYVALTSNDKPVLIEVKNGAKESLSKDNFQAEFYNSLGKTVGVVVHDLAFKDGIVSPSIQFHLEQDAETLILYPRLHKWRKITDTTNLDPDKIEEIWSAKQLGIIGRWPDIDCDYNCPHTRYKIVLPEDSLDTVAKPLPLIYAKGGADLGQDYDLHFIRRYISRTSPSATGNLWRLAGLSGNGSGLNSIIELMGKQLGIGKDECVKLLRWFNGISTGESGLRTRADLGKIEKEMAAYVEPWQKLLPRKMLETIGPTAQSIGTQTYNLPRQSKLFIDKSWKKWT
jgi:hypothetical protein